MLSSAIARTVEFCTRHIWAIIAAAVVLTIASGAYTAKHFTIKADVAKLIAPDLPWRQRELAYEAGFTHGTELIVAVLDELKPGFATASGQIAVVRLSNRRL